MTTASLITMTITELLEKDAAIREDIRIYLGSADFDPSKPEVLCDLARIRAELTRRVAVLA